MSANEMTVETLLRAHAPRAPESLRARVLALEPSPRRSASRRLLLVALPAAAALGVVAAVVHGVIGSNGSQPQPVAGKPLVAAEPGGGVTPKAPAPTFGAAGGAAVGAATAPVDRAHRAALAQSVAGGTGRLQHTDASLQVRVAGTKELAKATSAATRIATSLGGYAQSVVYRTPQSGGGASYIELRIPAQNVRTALARLAALGTLLSQDVSVQDLQQRFETESAQIAQLRRRIAALQRALRDPALPDAQRVLLQIKLAESKRALSQRLHARKGTVSAATNANVSLVLSTEKSIVPPAHRHGRLGRMLRSAVGFLALEGMIALYALIVVCPLALLAALLWWLARLWRRREADRLLAA